MNHSSNKEAEQYKAIAGCLAGLIGLPILIVISSIWSGYSFMLLWGWFIVPTFDLPPLLLWQAIGLDLVIGFLTHQWHDFQEKEREPWEKLAILVGRILFNPLIYLTIGWIVLQFSGR